MKRLFLMTTVLLSMISANSYAIYCGYAFCSATCTGHARTACLDKLTAECREHGFGAPINTGGTTYACYKP